MICPNCGEESFAKKKNVLSGWKITGTIEVCALCGAEWPQSKPEAENSAARERSRRLSRLLGGEEAAKVTLAGTAERSFCRNCKNFLAHPFKCVCALSHQEIDPMESGCKDFDDVNAP